MFEVEGCSWESLEHYNLSLEQQLLALGYCNLKMALRLVHYNLILIGLEEHYMLIDFENCKLKGHRNLMWVD